MEVLLDDHLATEVEKAETDACEAKNILCLNIRANNNISSP